MKNIKDYKSDVCDIIKDCSSKEDAIEKLKSQDYEINEEILDTFIKENNKGMPLSEEELSVVTGGADWYEQKYWLSKESVTFLFKVNDVVEVASGFGFGTTVRCRIKEVGYGYFSLSNGGNAYFDIYYCENLEYTWYFYDGWKSRENIQKR